MRTYYKNAWIILGLLVATFACTRKATDFRSFLDGKEITYPGAIQNVSVLPGNNRLMLEWHPSPDPSVSKYVVYWNNYADSLVVAATSHNPSDTVKCLVSNLEEYSYTFFIESYDGAGNKSINTEVDNARVYGDVYKSSLYNRPVNIDSPFIVSNDLSSVQLNFLAPDTINITTTIKYINQSGGLEEKFLAPNVNSLVLTDYKFGTPVLYQSSFIPKMGAIDTFYTSSYDTFPSIFRLVQCDKSLFKGTMLPYDMTADFGTSINELWDGVMTPKDYPNVYHSDGNGTFPRHFSFDMGKVYNNLAKIQEIGRGCCHNPTDFEVWGIADTTNAVLQIPANDANWKATAQAKGWTLLTEVVRADDGIVPINKTLIDNPPPVRYVMIRVLKTYDDPNYVNISQITFWNKE
ncbi:DUF4998 domain-containing protein [Arachidicoccus sp.]|jgi:hypothetical protein|uniref:DUF4998 domain-containing protein n=1 Tax=Arachidicoccus sp. TaxID=1872624 RepID=UPI003D1F16C3